MFLPFILFFVGFVDSQTQQCTTTSVPSSRSTVTANVYSTGEGESSSFIISTSSPSSYSQRGPPIVVLKSADGAECPRECVQMLSPYNSPSGSVMYGRALGIFPDLAPFGFTPNNDSPAIYCANAAGACGATVPIYRLFKFTLQGIRYSYAFSDNETTDGFTRELTPLCYGWITGAINDTKKSVSIRDVGECSQDITSSGASSLLVDLNYYDNQQSGVMHDHYLTTVKPPAEEGYQLTKTFGRVLTTPSNECPCTVELKQMFDNSTGLFARLDHKLVRSTVEQDRLFEHYVPTGETVYCAQNSGDCGATLPLYKNFHFLESDSWYDTDSTSAIFSYLYPESALCYIWSTDDNNQNPSVSPNNLDSDSPDAKTITMATIMVPLVPIRTTVSSATVTNREASAESGKKLENGAATPVGISNIPSEERSETSGELVSLEPTVGPTIGGAASGKKDDTIKSTHNHPMAIMKQSEVIDKDDVITTTTETVASTDAPTDAMSLSDESFDNIQVLTTKKHRTTRSSANHVLKEDQIPAKQSKRLKRSPNMYNDEELTEDTTPDSSAKQSKRLKRSPNMYNDEELTEDTTPDSSAKQSKRLKRSPNMYNDEELTEDTTPDSSAKQSKRLKRSPNMYNDEELTEDTTPESWAKPKRLKRSPNMYGDEELAEDTTPDSSAKQSKRLKRSPNMYNDEELTEDTTPDSSAKQSKRLKRSPNMFNGELTSDASTPETSTIIE